MIWGALMKYWRDCSPLSPHLPLLKVKSKLVLVMWSCVTFKFIIEYGGVVDDQPLFTSQYLFTISAFHHLTKNTGRHPRTGATAGLEGRERGRGEGEEREAGEGERREGEGGRERSFMKSAFWQSTRVLISHQTLFTELAKVESVVITDALSTNALPHSRTECPTTCLRNAGGVVRGALTRTSSEPFITHTPGVHTHTISCAFTRICWLVSQFFSL